MESGHFVMKKTKARYSYGSYVYGTAMVAVMHSKMCTEQILLAMNSKLHLPPYLGGGKGEGVKGKGKGKG